MEAASYPEMNQIKNDQRIIPFVYPKDKEKTRVTPVHNNHITILYKVRPVMVKIKEYK